MTLGRVLLLSAFAGKASLGQATIPAPSTQPPQIVTSAQSEARAHPDRATVTVGVQTRAITAADAAAQNARKQRAIIDATRARGVAAADVATSSYNVNPETRYREGEPPITTGFVVSNELTVDLRSVDLVGPVIDAALSSGANQINSLSFGVANADSVRRLALASAVAKARADADAMARAAGGALGPLLELTSTDMYSPPGPRPVMALARAAGAGESTPIEPGQETIRASVTARWQFVSKAP